MQNAGLTAWIALGPTVNGSDIVGRVWFQWDPAPYDAADWFANNASQEIHPNPNSYWVACLH